MHPGSIHYGIEPYSYILADVVANHGLKYGTAFGGVTTLSNDHCILFLNEVEACVSVMVAVAESPEKKYSVLSYLMAMVPDGARKYPLHAPDSLKGEEHVIKEIQLIRDVLASGIIDSVLKGDLSWIAPVEEFEKEYDRLMDEYLIQIDDVHPESDSIWQKQKEFDLTWMDDVRRILAEQESKS